ncbi:MAG: SLC13 family permease [Halobacteriales archaeon]
MPFGLTGEILVVVGVIALALALFVTQPVPIDVSALGILVLVILLEPWTGVGPIEGVSGFSNPATLTVLAMFVLSEGVRKTGVIQTLVRVVSRRTGTSETRQLLAIVGLAGPSAAIVNNTPIVAVLIPAVQGIAERANTSPSKLLIPLSYAAMLGGTLTLIGTSSNLLASDIWSRQDVPGAEAFAMFEFTALGVVVLTVGGLYLLTIGRYLTPARIEAVDGSAYRVAEYVTELVVPPASAHIGATVDEVRATTELDLKVTQLVRRGRPILRDLGSRTLQAGDVLVVRAADESIQEIMAAADLDLLPEVLEDAEEAPAGVRFAPPDDGEVPEDLPDVLTEIVILPGMQPGGRPTDIERFQRSYDVTVLAIRRGSSIIRDRLGDVQLRVGDTLLVQADEPAIDRLREDRSIVVSGEGRWEAFDRTKLPLAAGIVVGVVALAALEVVPIMVGALGGIVAMVATGCLRPEEAYDAVNWDVIFLLAGVIPLGIAMEASGTAAYVADAVVRLGDVLPAVAMLGVFYLFTALLTELVSNNASIVLMVPVAVDAALALGADPFAFVLAVTFAASTAFMTPVGYQTNLMVYGPGGYRFTDYARVGVPLQLVLAVVTPLGITAIWGV